jgi:hypothetical protein
VQQQEKAIPPFLLVAPRTQDKDRKHAARLNYGPLVRLPVAARGAHWFASAFGQRHYALRAQPLASSLKLGWRQRGDRRLYVTTRSVVCGDKLDTDKVTGRAAVTINEQITKRFADLADQAKKIRIAPTDGYGSETVDTEQFHLWASSAMHLVAAVFGEQSSHYKNLAVAHDAFNTGVTSLGRARGSFMAAKSDYDGGYLLSLQATVAGEVFGDFVTAARIALDDGQKDVAAVLACAALEDALKRFAHLQGLSVEDKDMSDVINALKGAGLLHGPQKTIIDAMPKIRNAAMHAEWQKITRENVGSVLGFVEQFLLTKFA